MEKRVKFTMPLPNSLISYIQGAARNDFSDLKQYIQRQYIDVIQFNLDDLLEELFRYLILLTDYSENDEIGISPSQVIDQALHCLILDPMLYYRVCDEILFLVGLDKATRPIRVLPHNPLGGDNAKARQNRFQHTLEKYKLKFHRDPPGQFWKNSSSDSRNGTSDNSNMDVVADEASEQEGILSQDDTSTPSNTSDSVSSQDNVSLPTTTVPTRILKPIYIRTPTNDKEYELTIKTAFETPHRIIKIKVGSRSETVDNLKGRIFESYGYPVERQRLIFAGIQLESDYGRKLRDYNVCSKAVVYLLLKDPPTGGVLTEYLPPAPLVHDPTIAQIPPFVPTPINEAQLEVIVKTLTGNSINIMVGAVTETVLNLKWRIMDIEGVDVEDQRLIISGRQIQDEELLSKYCNVSQEEKTVIHLVKRLRGC